MSNRLLGRMLKQSEAHSHEGTEPKRRSKHYTTEAEQRALGMCIRCTINKSDNPKSGMCNVCKDDLVRRTTEAWKRSMVEMTSSPNWPRSVNG